MKLKRGVMTASEFDGLEWVNSDPLKLSDLKGRVVLVHFWDYTCIHCLRAMAYIKVWYGRYHDKGLVIAGIHAPEFPFGKEIANVRRAVEEMDLQFPVALDNEFASWHRYSNRFWPASYLVDREGFLSDYHFGEGGYQETELAIQTLLREMNPRLLLPRLIEPLRPEDAGTVVCRPVTPEVYLGFRRGRIGNPEGFQPGKVVRYDRPGTRVRDVFYCEGSFLNESDCLTTVPDGPHKLILSYDAKEVNVVAEPAPGVARTRFSIEQDIGVPDAEVLGESVGVVGSSAIVECDAPRLYQVIRNRECGRHTLVLHPDSGVRFYCLSFVGGVKS